MLPSIAPVLHKPSKLAHTCLASLALLIITSPAIASPRPQALSEGTTASTDSITMDAGSIEDQPDATCPSGGQCFADVPSTNPFYTFINRIYQQDLVTGYPCGAPNEPCDPQSRPYYRPVNNVTRQQMAKFIDNARRLPQINIETDNANPAIYISNTVGRAIQVETNNSIALAGTSYGSGYAVAGISRSGVGVYGTSNLNIGVYGFSNNDYGVYGNSLTSQAGHFQGDVQVTGTLSKGGGSFKIDHPLDPANKYLYHSFVESPDMMNVYNGNVTTDDKGDAVVELPEWFSALNRDFRYQLTTIGQHADAWVASEIRDNSFSIKTDKPNVKVSWQVSGIRQDPYANAHRIPVEEKKPADEQGKYLHPTEWGHPVSMGIGYDEIQQASLLNAGRP